MFGLLYGPTQGHLEEIFSLFKTSVSSLVKWGKWNYLFLRHVVKLNEIMNLKCLVWFLEKAMAPNSSTLAWKIPWMEEPGGLQSMGSLRVGHDWMTSLPRFGEGNGNPLQCSCLENPRDGGAWWAAVYGVAQSRIRLKWLSSSSSSIMRVITAPACKPTYTKFLFEVGSCTAGDSLVHREIIINSYS